MSQQYPGQPPFLQPAQVPQQAPQQAPQGAPAYAPPPQGAPVPSGYTPYAPQAPQAPQPAYPPPQGAPPGYAAPQVPPGYPPIQGMPPGFVPPPPGYGAPPAPVQPAMPWDNGSNVALQEEGVKLAEGMYVVRLDNCIAKNTTYKGFCLIAEFTIMTSTNPASAVGTKASYVQDFRYPDKANSNLMFFVAALTGKNMKDKNQEAEVRGIYKQLVDATLAGSHNGRFLQVRSTVALAKEGNRPYAKYAFSLPPS